GQGERNRPGQEAAPCQKPVSRPAHMRPALNETLQHEVVQEDLKKVSQILPESPRRQEELPAAIPIETGWWPPQPHREAIAQSRSGEQSGASVRDESGVKVAQAPAADIDAANQRRCGEQT